MYELGDCENNVDDYIDSLRRCNVDEERVIVLEAGIRDFLANCRQREEDDNV